MSAAPDYPPPEGYIAWHDWAARQDKKGHKQVKCGLCCKFKFPVELSGRTIVGEVQDSRGRKYRTESPVCKGCAAIGVRG